MDEEIYEKKEDVILEEEQVEDSREDIQKCLNCQYPECINCLDNRVDRMLYQRKKREEDLASEIDDLVDPPVPEEAKISSNPNVYSVYMCYINGFNDEETAGILGISKNWAKEIREAMELKAFTKHERLVRQTRFKMQ